MKYLLGYISKFNIFFPVSLQKLELMTQIM